MTVPSSDVRIRRARLDDADALARVMIDGWRAAYRGIFSDGFLEDLATAPRRTHRRLTWRDRVDVAADRAPVIVAETGGRVVGFVSAGPQPEAPADPAVEIYAVYVDPDRWGQGIGAALLDEALRIVRRAGYGSAVLWALEGNTRARAFYESRGWVFESISRTRDFDGEAAVEVRYRYTW